MLCATILRPLAQTTDLLSERRTMDFSWSMRMSPMFSENVCFVQPFDSMWPKPPTFSHNAEKWTEIDLCEWGQYLPKMYALCNHFTTCSPNFRLFRRMAKNWTEIDKCECGQYLAKTYALCNHFTAFFAERLKMDWDRSCERVQYLAKTYALCNHFTAGSPNFRLFRRMAKSAKTGLKSIYANEANISPKPMLCAAILRHVAQTADFFLERRKMDFNWSMRMSPIFSENVCFVQPFDGMWPKPPTFNFRTMPKNVLKSINAETISSRNVCFVQPFYGMWPKPQTFSQKGEKWTEIDLSEWVLYFAKTDALSNHLTAWGSTYRLFRRMPKNGLKSINANETNI